MLIKKTCCSRPHCSNAPSDAVTSAAVQNRIRRVLVVDDNALVGSIISALLEREGCRVKLCPEGMSALASASDETFDDILVDYSMPEMNGAAVTLMLRQSHPSANIVGMSLVDRSREFIAAGADKFIKKPFSIDELMKLMKIADTMEQQG